MRGTCPFPCTNKTEFGYCKTMACLYAPTIRVTSTPQTNADRIRAMTDEELSRFLAGGCEIAGLECRVARDPLFPADEHLEDCAECWQAWLQKEADNG